MSGTSYWPINWIFIPTITPCKHLMGELKYYFINLDLESLNNLRFQSSILEAVAEVAAVTSEDMEEDVLFVVVVVDSVFR